MDRPSDAVDAAMQALTELFSQPIKNPLKSFRRYDLRIENGEPVFTLCKFDRMWEEIMKEMFGPPTEE